MQRANELCNHIKTLLHERELSELTLYACDFCGSNTNIDNFDDFIAEFRDSLPWDDIDINDFTWDDSCDLYGIAALCSKSREDVLIVLKRSNTMKKARCSH